MTNRPKIFVFDIETAPLTVYAWGLRDQNISLGQVKTDWHMLAWAGKWYGKPEMTYMDNSKRKDVTNDKALIKGLWKKLNEADVVITQNGDKFDIKKFNARAAIHGLPPVTPFKSTDTLKESRKVFSFTSHSLDYMSSVLNTKYKKLKHEKYPGFSLWTAVLKGDKKAWKEMKIYCTHDVLATEELFEKIQGWIKTHNMAVYFDDGAMRCVCGSKRLVKDGPVYIKSGKYQGYKCNDCKKRPHGRVNLLSEEKKKNLLKEGNQ